MLWGLQQENTAVLREAWATLPESSNRPLPATPAQSRNLAHASLETAVYLLLWKLELSHFHALTNIFCFPPRFGRFPGPS